MPWKEALDTALADSLADQLQVLTRDEQQVIDAYIEHAGRPADFIARFRSILDDLPPGRRPSLLRSLQKADQRRHGKSDINLLGGEMPTDAQISRLFHLEQPLALPPQGVFRSRLYDLIGERGL